MARLEGEAGFLFSGFGVLATASSGILSWFARLRTSWDSRITSVSEVLPRHCVPHTHVQLQGIVKLRMLGLGGLSDLVCSEILCMSRC